MKGVEGGKTRRNESSRINVKMTISKGGQGDFAAVHPPVWNGRA
jgi:hypothetical protein